MAHEAKAALESQAGRVEVDEGVVFGTGGGRELRCDIFRPPHPRADGKSGLLIHGGAWVQGDRSQLRGYGILLGRQGYVAVATEYRLTGESKWPAQLHDVKACLRFMRERSRELAIDPDKISAWGNSAGGHLALLLAGTPGVAELEGDGGHAGQPTHIEACVAFYPPVVCTAANRTDNGIPALFQADASDDELRQASPLHHARPDFPPTLLLHGDRDKLVSARASFDMHAALSRAGARVELHVFSDAPHAFDAGRSLGRLSEQLAHSFLERHT
jgi:acetyl esterase/lipase